MFGYKIGFIDISISDIANCIDLVLLATGKKYSEVLLYIVQVNKRYDRWSCVLITNWY